MTEIRSIIVDDEQANRIILNSLLERYCPGIRVVGTASSAAEGCVLISDLQPDLVFVDVRMPGQNGFDMLRMFGNIDFQVIFVTAYDEYAITAFEFSAVDYIVKPVDYTKLVNSVNKAVRNIELQIRHSVGQFIHTIDGGPRLLKSIALHRKDKVVIVEIAKICYIRAVRNYCEVVTEDNQRLLSAKTLFDYEKLLAPHTGFTRINKGMLINVHYVKEYSKGSVCFVTLRNCPDELEVSRRKKGEILHLLKESKLVV